MNPSIELYSRIAGHLPRPVVSRMYASPWLTRIIRTGMNAVVPRDLREVRVEAGPLTGNKLCIYPRSELSFVSGLWEFWVQDALVTHLKPGDIAWDVGAYIGYFTLLMRQRCGPNRVIAFEPDPVNRARLERVLTLNHIDDVRVIPVAVGETESVASLEKKSDGPASTGLAREGRGVVPITTLDAACAELGAPALIKMDIEGSEADALRGASHLVTVVRPIFLIELHGAAGSEAVKTLRDAGYRIDHLNRTESRTHQVHVIAMPA